MSQIFDQLISPIETLDPLVLTAAAPSFQQNVDASFLSIESADEAIDVYLNKSTRPMKMTANDFYSMPVVGGVQTRFNHVRIVRRSAAALASNTVILSIGSGDYRRGTVSVAATVLNRSAATLDGSAGAGLVLVPAVNTQLFTANALRRCARIRNTHATLAVRLSSVAADLSAGNGELLNPGEVIELFVTGPIFVRSTGAATIERAQELF